MTREEYLTLHSPSYPALPSDAKAWGRLVALDPDRGLLGLRRGNRVIDVRAHGPLEVLRPGDLVAVRNDDSFLVLAPARRDLPLFRTGGSTLRRWSRFLAEVRKFFSDREFLEVATPGLVPCPGTEPSLDVFSTEFVRGSQRRTYFLPTSPELHLKKALAHGLEKICEIKSCFRNGEITAHHQPEFTMLEWYRAWEGPEAIRKDLVALIETLADVFAADGPLRPKRIERHGMAELFERILGARLTPESCIEEYVAIAQGAGLEVRPGMTIDDVFFLIFIEKIEPTFDAETMVIVDRWPPFQAALARLTEDGWGDRFEAYWRGLELANAFHELNDPDVQRHRFVEDFEKREAWGKTPVPLDEEFLKCLEAGIPPSAGIALGLERLYMAMFSVRDIAEIKLFPYGERR